MADSSIRYPTVAITNLETAEAVTLADNLIVNQADTTRKAALASILSSLGIMRCIFFSEGGALESKKDVAYFEEDGAFYTWNGDYPKLIEAGATPETAGGLGQTGFTSFSGGSSGGGGNKIYDLGSIGSTLALDLSKASIFTFSLTEANTSLSLNNASSQKGYAQEYTLVITQGVGAGVITWPDNIRWQYGNAPVLSFTQGLVDIVNLVTFDNGVSWIGSLSLGGIK